MKKAYIDIGTNTVLILLVDVQSDGQYTLLADECHIARLGEGLSQHAAFLPAAQERVIKALLHFQKICQQHHCTHVRLVGTAAFRRAANGAQFVDEILQKTGFSVEVISGEEEARLISNATLADFQNLPMPLLTLDIGGGSTEFIVNQQGFSRELYSLPFGAVRLHEEFLAPQEIPSAENLVALQDFVRVQVQNVKSQFSSLPKSMVATAGTPTTAAALIQHLTEYDADRIHKSSLPIVDLEALFQKLVVLPLVEREKIPCLPKGRADVILAGLAILMGVMQGFGFDQTSVSDKGLRHGLLLENLGKNT